MKRYILSVERHIQSGGLDRRWTPEERVVLALDIAVGTQYPFPAESASDGRAIINVKDEDDVKFHETLKRENANEGTDVSWSY